MCVGHLVVIWSDWCGLLALAEWKSQQAARAGLLIAKQYHSYMQELLSERITNNEYKGTASQMCINWFGMKNIAPETFWWKLLRLFYFSFCRALKQLLKERPADPVDRLASLLEQQSGDFLLKISSMDNSTAPIIRLTTILFQITPKKDEGVQKGFDRDLIEIPVVFKG